MITYSYLDHDDAAKYYSVEFHPIVKEIMNKINDDFGYELDVCFLNLYMDQSNALGWHADDSHTIDQNQPIAVVSFGAEREIWIKSKGDKGEVPSENRQLLKNGSLYVMPAGFQSEWLHKIPKCDKICGPRVSLTFRKFLSK